MRVAQFQSGIIFYGIIELIIALILFGILVLFLRKRVPLKRRAIICSVVFLITFMLSTSMFLLMDLRYTIGADYKKSNVDISILATLTEEQISKAKGIGRFILEQENIKPFGSGGAPSLYGTGVVGRSEFLWQEREPYYRQISVYIYYMEDELSAENRMQIYRGKRDIDESDKLTYVSYDNGIEALLFDSKKMAHADWSYANTGTRALRTMIRFRSIIIELFDLPDVADLHDPFSNQCIALIYHALM